MEKALLPGMWSLLEAGGYGSAKVIYPCLLPLLSRLLEKVSQWVAAMLVYTLLWCTLLWCMHGSGIQ